MGVMNECGLGCWALWGERGVCSLHWALCLFLGSHELQRLGIVHGMAHLLAVPADVFMI